MNAVLFSVAFLVAGVIGFCAVIVYNTWREKRTQAQMARDHQWRMWVGQVRARLENLEGDSTSVIMGRESEWFHELWDDKFSPGAAAEKWMAERRRAFHESF